MTYSKALRLNGLFFASIIIINLIAMPAFAQEIHPIIDKKPEITLHHEGLVKPDETTAVNLDKPLLQNSETVALAPPETAEQTWFSSFTGSLVKKMKKFHLINPVYESVAVIKPTPVSNEKEIGFLTRQQSDAKPITSYVSKIILENKNGYALNFDGGELVHFNLPKLMKNVSSNTKKPNKKSAFLTRKGKILLPGDIKTHIIEHSINRTGYEEANHIFIKDNHLVLDLKEVRVNNQSKVDYQLNQAIENINKQIKSH